MGLFVRAAKCDGGAICRSWKVNCPKKHIPFELPNESPLIIDAVEYIFFLSKKPVTFIAYTLPSTKYLAGDFIAILLLNTG